MDVKNLDEKLLTLSEACRMFPNKPSPATLWRWRVKGVNGVRLSCIRVGRSWLTTKAALLDFLEKQTQAHTTETPPKSSTTGGAERSEALTRRLREAGCLSPSKASDTRKRSTTRQ